MSDMPPEIDITSATMDALQETSWLIPDLPAPWIFDGYRRIWNEGKPTGLWQARAVNPLSAETEASGKTSVDWMGGVGSTMAEAVEALLDAMKASKPES